MNGARRIRSKKLREHNTKGFDSIIVEWDQNSEVGRICERVKQAVADSEREVCCSVNVRRKKLKSKKESDEVKDAVERKKTA